MKKSLIVKSKKVLASLYYFVINIIANFLIRISKFVANQYKTVWPYLNTSWFDHRFDYLRGMENYFWYERVIFANQRIKLNSEVLDIGCGDGVYSGLFYSRKAKNIDAIDIDKNAIKHAKKNYFRKNVNFYNSNIQDWLKHQNKYDIILMFAVIEHFSFKNGILVLKKISSSLKKGGIFFGSTPIFKKKGDHNFEHKNEFASQRELYRFLNKVFSKVDLFISEWPDGRKECYFECSLPR